MSEQREEGKKDGRERKGAGERGSFLPYVFQLEGMNEGKERGNKKGEKRTLYLFSDEFHCAILSDTSSDLISMPLLEFISAHIEKKEIKGK